MGEHDHEMIIGEHDHHGRAWGGAWGRAPCPERVELLDRPVPPRVQGVVQGALRG